MTEILVMSNRYPDLDGCACSYAYSEFLNKTGKKALAVYQDPQFEAEFVFEKLGIDLSNNALDLIPDCDEIVLVDSSHTGLNNMAPIEKVIEVIDHRKFTDVENFPNAKADIQLLGSATTIVAERFKNSGLEISEKSALLLYYTAVSHTVNFKTGVTTQKDIDMAEWLKKFCSPDEDFVHQMFVAKSKLNKSLEQALIDETAERVVDGKMCVIVQLEMLDTEEFLEENRSEIEKYLKKQKMSYEADIIFLTMLDLEEEKNIFLVVDDFSENVLSKFLDCNFENGVFVRKGLLLRKEMWQLTIYSG